MAVESLSRRRGRAGKIIRILKKTYPDAGIALNYRNPLELLVATILSAQCTDKRVNMVTDSLFVRYRTARDYAAADPKVFEEEIRSTGFFRNKTRAVLGAAERISKVFGGKVPDNMADLLTLPGVARKTANVVLNGAYGKSEGIVVDTHVTRVAGRLRLTKHRDNAGDRIEKDLLELVPPREWGGFGNLLIWHGRLICSARRPECPRCPLGNDCPSASEFS
jgi:endonuclease-3